MNKSDLVDSVAALKQLDPEVARDAVEGFIEVVELALSCDESVTINGFGRFESRHQRPVTRTTPQGTTVNVPAKRKPSFHPSPQLKKRINRAGS